MNTTVQIDKNSPVYKELVNSTVRLTNYLNILGVQTDLFGITRVTVPIVTLATLQLKYNTDSEEYERIHPLVYWHTTVFATLLGCTQETLTKTWNKKVPKTRVSKKAIHEEDLFFIDEAIEGFCELFNITKLSTYEDILAGWDRACLNIPNLKKQLKANPEFALMTDIFVNAKFRGMHLDDDTFAAMHIHFQEYASLLKETVAGSSIVFTSKDNRVRASAYRISQLLHVSNECGYVFNEMCPNLLSLAKPNLKNVMKAAQDILPQTSNVSLKNAKSLADAIECDENLTKLFRTRNLFHDGLNVPVSPEYKNKYGDYLPILTVDELVDIDKQIVDDSAEFTEDFIFGAEDTEEHFTNALNPHQDVSELYAESDSDLIANKLTTVVERIAIQYVLGLAVVLLCSRYWIVGNTVDPLVTYSLIGDNVENLWSKIGTFGVVEAIQQCENDSLLTAQTTVELLIESLKIGIFIKRSPSVRNKRQSFIFRDIECTDESVIGVISSGLHKSPDTFLRFLNTVTDDPKDLIEYVKSKFDIVGRRFPNLDVKEMYKAWEKDNMLPAFINPEVFSDELVNFIQSNEKLIFSFSNQEVYSSVDVIAAISNAELCQKYDFTEEDLRHLVTLRFNMFFELACNNLVKSIIESLKEDESGISPVFDLVKEDNYPSAVSGSERDRISAMMDDGVDTGVSSIADDVSSDLIVPVDKTQSELMESIEDIKDATSVDEYKAVLNTVARMGSSGSTKGGSGSAKDGSGSEKGDAVESNKSSKKDASAEGGSVESGSVEGGSVESGSGSDNGSSTACGSDKGGSDKSSSDKDSAAVDSDKDSTEVSQKSKNTPEVKPKDKVENKPDEIIDNSTVLNSKPYLEQYKDLFNANWECNEAFNNTAILWKKIFGTEPEIVQIPELRIGEKYTTGKHTADREFNAAACAVGLTHPSMNVITDKMYKIPRSDLDRRMIRCMNSYNKWKNKANFFTCLPDWGLSLPRFDESYCLAPAMYAEYTHSRSMLCAYEWTAGVNGFSKEWVAHQAYLAMVSPSACMTGLSSINSNKKFEFPRLPITLFNSDIERAIDSNMNLTWVKEWLQSDFTKTVVVNGNKGSGKTSLCRTLAAIAGTVFDRSSIYYITPNVFNRQAMQIDGVETILSNQLSNILQYTAYPVVLVVEDLDSYSSGGRDDNIGEFIRAMTNLAAKFNNLYFIASCDSARFNSASGSIPGGNFISLSVDKDFVTEKSIMKVCDQILNSLKVPHMPREDMKAILHKCEILAKKYITSCVHPRSTLTVFERLMMQYKDKVNKEVTSIDPNGVLTFFAENSQSIVKQLTGKDYTFIKLDSKIDLVNIESELKKSIKGQDDAIVSIARGLRRAYFDFKDPTRPIASMLFVGPTGVGKTGLVKALAKFQFGSESSMIRVDMSEYNMEFNISKFIGSPPGYVGYREGVAVTDKILQNPQSILLLDEIEKADPKVLNLLLQILEDGRITDACGTVVDCSNLIVIMTSNIGSRELFDKKGSLGFSVSAEAKYYSNQEVVMSEVKRVITPELLNRLDQVVVFNSITEDIIPDIFDNIVTEVSDRFDARGINIVISDDAKAELCRQGFDPKFGARPLRRAVENKVVDGAILAMLNAGIDHDCRITVEFSTSEDDFKFDVVKSK